MKSSSSVSRRQFLAGASVGAAALAGLGIAGCAPTASTKTVDSAAFDETTQNASSSDIHPDSIQAVAATEPASSESRETDIVIVGSGIGGMSAAVQASLAGAKVIILEKSKVTGGDSSICTGNFYCCGSKYQDSLGLTDYGTAEEIAQFYLAQSDGDANIDICRMVAENSGAAMDWLVSFGCEFEKKKGENISDRSMVSKNGGKGIIDTLIGVAENNGAELMMETRAVEVMTENGRVSGIKARQGDKEIVISAKAVILATGGFDGQDWSKALYAPGSVGWNSLSNPDNTGDGIELAKQAGAAPIIKGGMSQIHLVGREYVPLNDPISALRMINTGVFLSDLGYRCANESMTSQFDYFVPFVQSGRAHFFILVDSQQPEDRIELLEKALEAKVAHKADTIAEVSTAAGLEPYIVEKTIAHYNELCDAGADPDFHKKPEDLQRIEEGPFYIVEITPNTNDSFGQVPISTKSEALDANRNPVPGLYAAGTLGNVELFYMRYAISGASMCMGTVTGRIAADSAMEYYSA